MSTVYEGQPTKIEITPAETPFITLLDSDCNGDIPEGDTLNIDRSGRELHKALPDHKRYWRQMVGTYLRNELHLCPELSSATIFDLEVPTGYELYESTRDSGAKDYYLIGFHNDGNKEKFDSPANFVMHAKWIAYGCPRDACECRPCTGRLQGEISKRLTLGTAKIKKPRDEETSAHSRRVRQRNEAVARVSKRNIRRTRGNAEASANAEVEPEQEELDELEESAE